MQNLEFKIWKNGYTKAGRVFQNATVWHQKR